MAREVEAPQAELNFEHLLDDVERGETIIITRHGRAIAWIVPEARVRQREIDQVTEDLKELGKETATVTIEEILARRDAGRKY